MLCIGFAHLIYLSILLSGLQFHQLAHVFIKSRVRNIHAFSAGDFCLALCIHCSNRKAHRNPVIQMAVDHCAVKRSATADDQFLSMSGMTVDRGLIVLDGVLALLMMWLGVMCNIWTINAAYAFGHAFTKGKRIWSVVFFALIQMIYGILVVVFSEILSKQDIDLFLEQISSTAKQYLIVLVTVTIIEVVGIAVLSVATTLPCKHKLNLE